MKYLGVVLAAVLGGGVGAACLYLMTPGNEANTREVAAPSTLDGADDVAQLRLENDALQTRVEKLEGSLSEALLAANRGTVPAPDLDALRAEILKQAREEARAEVLAAAKNPTPRTEPEATPAAPLDRDGLIAAAFTDLESKDAAVRRDAIRRLRKLKLTDGGAAMVAALADTDLKVQEEAAKFFEDHWSVAALEPLVKLMNGADPGVGEKALDALCKSGDEQAQQEIETYYLSGTDLELAYEAGKALEENNRLTSLPTGVQRYRDALAHTDPNQRELGLKGLARWSTSVDETLVRPLLNDAHPGVREEAKDTLRKWGLE